MTSRQEEDILFEDSINIYGAKEHNLKNIQLKIPRNKLVVITGMSGSGKSSLAFDTLFAEGQRRYMETFSAYARQFIGKIERPNVEKIDGLSPVISIEQKTTGWNPRSTVGTITEIYDFLRLLYARIGEAYSYISGNKMEKLTEQEIISKVLEDFKEESIIILAPVVKGRKGHYKELFEHVRKQGFTKMRIDGEIQELRSGMQVDRFKVHDIEIVIDRIKVQMDKTERITSSLQAALKLGEGLLYIQKMEDATTKAYSKHLMEEEDNISYQEPSPNSFSFNSPYGYCPTCKGLGLVTSIDMHKIIPDDTKSINEIGIVPFGEVRENSLFTELRIISNKFGFTFATPVKDIPTEALDLILKGGHSGDKNRPLFADELANITRHGLNNMLTKWYIESDSERIKKWAESFMSINQCPECHGQRLKKESLHFKIGNKNISELGQLDLKELFDWFELLPMKLSEKQKTIGQEILKEIRLRLSFLLEVGLDYLTLDRPARTLSGGESQRTRLANQIGSQLSGITYIMDEPSIGLHQRDNQRLIHALRKLNEIGNSVIVVEHDKDIMLAADYIIDLGPGAGKNGGELIAQGRPIDFLNLQNSQTADYLARRSNIEIPLKTRKGNGQLLVLKGASGNTLKDVDLTIPLGTFVCVTGVSGSGKSTLINETLYPILRQKLHHSHQAPLAYKKLEGLEYIDKVIEIDQSPIGRTPRSNPVTYIDVFSDIRKLLSDVPEAKIRGYKPGRFSFNVKGGRCDGCEGGGQKVIQMNFLPDVYVECETCFGKRYNRETLEILYKQKNISDILDMSVDEAVVFFENIPNIYRKLKTLQDVGLGYINLGQQATTLSGGEAQRVKLSEELSKKDTGKTLYILDEPTTGLHFGDIKKLLEVLQKLVDKGNTVIVIEHNLDVIKVADYIVDLGLEGGNKGGTIVYQGDAKAFLKSEESITAHYLRRELAE